MKTHVFKRLSAVFLSVAMTLTFVPYSPTVEAAGTTYTLDTTADLTAAAAGSLPADTKAGTSNYFKIYYNTSKAKIDASSKSFSDNYSGSQRINFNEKSNFSTPMSVIEFTTNAAATVKVWWACGDVGRQISIVKKGGSAVYTSNDSLAKNEAKVSPIISLPEAGTYLLGNPDGNNYFFKIEVVDGGAPPERKKWSEVAAPTITSAAANGSKIDVNVSAVVGTDGGDEVKVIMYKNGKEVGNGSSAATASSHTVSLTPTASGDYTFKAVLSRSGEADKPSAASSPVSFTLPLGTPSIKTATSKGGGSIEVVWNAVAEATGYKVYNGSDLVTTVTGTSYTVTGLTVGNSYTFKVSALRGDEESAQSSGVTAEATQDEQIAWGFVYYGPSASSSKNKATGNLATGSSVQVSSTGNGGKIQPASTDGLAFYYTPISNSKNFTLKADITVDSWTYSNGQEGFGLMAIDSLPASGAANFWSNQYMAVVSKVEYRWEPTLGDITLDPNAGSKYTMRLGVGVNTKLGITPAKQAILDEGKNTTEIVANFGTFYPLETTAADLGLPAGNYNIVGGATNIDKVDPAAGDLLTKFTLEIQRNNTGYFITYYDQSGNVVRKQKFYDPDALSLLDTDNVYVGFFAARNATVTVSNVQLTTINPANDAPAEEKPVNTITPNFTIKSAAVANSENYTLSFTSNVAGTANVFLNNYLAKGNVRVEADATVNCDITITKGNNNIRVVFTPDPDQKLDNAVLENTDRIEKSITVNYNNAFAKRTNLYVAPDGTSSGDGSSENPLDIYTAVKVAQPGQSIIIKAGTYSLVKPVRVERGIDGASGKLIRMIADPEASTRPVFDFLKISEGFKCGGDYWYFKGFDVTNTANGKGGFYLCGSYCTMDQINAYHNGNTGIQVSAFNNSADPRSMWPHDDLILNCTSYGNADAGYEDADGFAAKLTIGDNIVFDGCIAHHNADDGWDLFAKVETGSIGAVTIKNSVAYANGILEDGTDAGNGNGFKLGGSNLPGGHKLINSVAFNNKANGITCNSCPDISVENCTSYNNGGKNLTLYTNAGSETDFSVKGLISYKGGTNDDVKPKGSQVESKYSNDTNYYWIGGSSKHYDSSGDPLSDDMFTSLTFNPPIKRTESGTIDLEGFLELNEKAPAGAGASNDKIMEGRPSADITVSPTDDEQPAPGGQFLVPAADPSESTDNAPVQTIKEDESGVSVTGSIPEGTALKVEPQPAAETETTVVFDITLADKDGKAVKFNGSVEVKLPIPVKFKGQVCFVYREEADGSYTDMKAKVEDGNLIFTTDHFSRYIITIQKMADTNVNKGDDKNVNTGVTVTFVPVALAAAGVLFSKKKK